jgi:hypothetical protein
LGKIGIAGVLGKIPNFNSAAWIFNMKNRFKWTDRHELSGDQDKPIQITVANKSLMDFETTEYDTQD